MFIAQSLVEPRKQLKQIIQIKHNTVKNPNWPEANQFSIYKHGRGFVIGATVKQIQVHVVIRAGLEPGTAGLRDRRADHSATLYASPFTFLLCSVAAQGKARLPFPLSINVVTQIKWERY